MVYEECSKLKVHWMAKFFELSEYHCVETRTRNMKKIFIIFRKSRIKKKNNKNEARSNKSI